MKKFISVVISISMTISILACNMSNNNNSDTGSEDSIVSENQNNESNLTQQSNESSESSGEEITITLPETVFQDEMDFDPQEYTSENGFNKTVVNEDGSVSITMSRQKHEEMVLEMKEGIEELFTELTASDEMGYISKIESTENYDVVTVHVDREKHEETILDLTPFIIGLSAMVYQYYIGAEIKTTIITKDEQTGDTINTVIYPDDLETAG